MSDFEKAFNQLSKVGLENHTELWGEPKTERDFFEAGKASKQAEIDGLKHQKSLQELEINQISQSNQEWQRINSELQKRIDDCAALAKEWRTLAREMCPLNDKYVIGARLGCAQDIEEVLRGEHE